MMRKCSVAKKCMVVFLYFAISTLVVFLLNNIVALNNIIHEHPEKAYTAEDVYFERWIPIGENKYCSENDPIIIFPNFNGYVHSVHLDITPADGIPVSTAKVYWTDARSPAFIEANSEIVQVKQTKEKTGGGYLFVIDKKVTNLRIDLYDNSGAVIIFNAAYINARNVSLPTTYAFPLVIIGLLIVLMLFSKKQRIDTCIVSSKPEKIEAISFIRAVCAIGVIAYHVSVYIGPENPKFLYSYANGSFGDLFVNLFLMISGGVLYYNYNDVRSLSLFYYKRWKSIFPMFYITYLFFFTQEVLNRGSVFYQGRPWSMLLSVFGIDGYMLYRIPNYYLVGEWFLGAIVILYLLYPFMLKLLNRLGWVSVAGMVLLLAWQIQTDVFQILVTRNLIFCGFMFFMGMFIFKYELMRIKSIQWGALIISVILLGYPISEFYLYKNILLYICLFIVMIQIGDQVMKFAPVKRVCDYIGGLSFPIFLVQNRIGTCLAGTMPANTMGKLLKMIGLTACLCIVLAWCFSVICKTILNTKWFLRMEEFFLTERNFYKEIKHGTD